MSSGLRTDLYQLTMAAGYPGRAIHDTATFSLCVRELPPERGFLVAAGSCSCLDWLEQLHFEPDDLAYRRHADRARAAPRRAAGAPAP